MSKQNINTAFLLFHVRPDNDDFKIIGMYSSREHAEEAITRARNKPGFCKYPEHFAIDEYRLDHDSWQEGFQDL